MFETEFVEKVKTQYHFIYICSKMLPFMMYLPIYLPIYPVCNSSLHLVHCVRVMSVGCTSSTPILVQPTDITARSVTSAACLALSEDEQVMLETCRGP
jgi:hypothetical protein